MSENRERVVRESPENHQRIARPADLPFLKDEVLLINKLAGEVQMSMNHGIITLDMTKNKPPVIITLLPGMSRQKFDALVKLDLDKIADPVKRPKLGTR